MKRKSDSLEVSLDKQNYFVVRHAFIIYLVIMIFILLALWLMKLGNESILEMSLKYYFTNFGAK
ncbi:MAG: hypothetical protein JST75_20490 [Bacteroidetes bacterium]|nr:hypothetical protein [Bacteroidota bacterium]